MNIIYGTELYTQVLKCQILCCTYFITSQKLIPQYTKNILNCRFKVVNYIIHKLCISKAIKIVLKIDVEAQILLKYYLYNCMEINTFDISYLISSKFS